METFGKPNGADRVGMMCAGMPSVPLPMAVVGMVIAFMLGATIGMAKSRRHEMMPHHMHEGGKPWMGRGMKGHHHHGDGSAACCERHEGWSMPQMSSGEDASEA
jgi:hypothetical protein